MDRPRAWHSNAIDLSVEPSFRIGGAAIDPVSREASSPGGRERLQPQNLKVLIALKRRQGQVVTRTDLIDLCWDGRIVGEDVINHSISVLRSFASRAGGFAIETVPKAGYRLIEAPGAGSPGTKRLALIALAAAAAVIAILLLAIPGPKQGEPPVPTVALAPFSAPVGDPAAAEVARGARVSLLRMMSDGGFPVRLAEQGNSPSDYLISGDVKRQAGHVEATVRVEEMRHHIVIFTHLFQAAEEDADDLPDQIGASLSANLSWTAALMILDRRHPTDPRIMGELLKQMSITVEGGDILQAYEIARQIAPKAPNSAIAQVALAFDTGFVLGRLPRDQREEALVLGRQASERALQLAPEFGDTHLTWCFLHSPVRRIECEARARQALAADPDSPFAAGFLSIIYSDAGRFDEALELSRMSIANDRYKTSKLSRMIRALELGGASDEAARLYGKAIRWWPGNERIRWGRLTGLIERGNFASLEQYARAEGTRLDGVRELTEALRTKDGAKARRQCSGPDREGPIEQLCLVVLADLGELDAAFDRARLIYPRMKGRDRAEAERLWLDRPNGYPTSTLAAPSAAALRKDKRYVELVDRVGLLDYWRSGRLPDFCRNRPEPVCAQVIR
jgi:DNA-binding winged helix-turn-helix (wHTH) protein/tetratricopeptide (TPR) repeat protein